MKLRAMVAAVLLVNGLFLAWTQEWLSPWLAPPLAGERDPARLKAQVRPEAIRVLTPVAASAAVQDARAATTADEQCLQAGPFTAGEADAAEAAWLGAGIARDTWQRRESPADASRVVLRLERTTPAVRGQLRASTVSVDSCPAG